MNYVIPKNDQINERLKLVYSSINISNIGMLITGIILVYVLKDDITHIKLFVWLSALFITSAITLTHKFYYSQRIKTTGISNPEKWENIFTFLVFIFAIIWGGAGVLLFPQDSPTNQAFLELIIVGVVAGSVGLLSPSLKAILFFMPICLIPLAYTILTSGNANDFEVTALILMYLIVSLVNGYKYNKRIREQIGLKNESLIREKILKESQNKYKILYENSEDAMLLIVDYKFSMANKAAVQAFGFDTTEELFKVRPFDTSPKYQPDGIKSDKKAIQISQVLKKEGFIRLEWVYKVKTGELRTADVTLTVVPYEDKRAVFCIMRDIEELKKIQNNLILAKKESEAANLSKSEFLANMSHEIRTPMNGVIGINNLMLHHNLDDEQRVRALAIKSSADSMLSVINDILDFSKIEAGQLKIENIAFNFVNFILDFSSSITNRIESKKLNFNYHIDDDLSHWYLGDSLRIKQIINNLVDNAIKFTPHGTINLNCSLQKDLADFHELKIEITDTGIGIPKDQQDAIFSRFVQADGSTSRKFGGTGLGLSICKQLTQLMGGKIGFSSVENQGTIFWLILKLKKISIPQLESQNRNSSQNQIRQINATVLVADDNHINQMVVQGMLEIYGINVELVDNGKQVISALQNKRYDLVLMDCHMPILDGYQATRLIRQNTDATINKTKIIAVTASAMQGDKEKCLASGMNDYISKPIEFDDLHGKLIKYLTG